MGREGVSVCLGLHVRVCDRYLALFLCVGACDRLRVSLFLSFCDQWGGVSVCVYACDRFLSVSRNVLCVLFFCNCPFNIRVSPSLYVIDCVLVILIDVEIRCESLPQDQ